MFYTLYLMSCRNKRINWVIAEALPVLIDPLHSGWK
jgi:hypothetical protein